MVRLSEQQGGILLIASDGLWDVADAEAVTQAICQADRWGRVPQGMGHMPGDGKWPRSQHSCAAMPCMAWPRLRPRSPPASLVPMFVLLHLHAWLQGEGWQCAGDHQRSHRARPEAAHQGRCDGWVARLRRRCRVSHLCQAPAVAMLASAGRRDGQAGQGPILATSAAHLLAASGPWHAWRAALVVRVWPASEWELRSPTKNLDDGEAAAFVS